MGQCYAILMATPRKKRGNPGGRPQFNGKPLDIVIQKLEHVWALGGSDAEAAFYADISKAALSDYLKRHPELSERRDALREKPILDIRKCVVEAAKTDPELGLKFLERARRSEFSLRSEVDHSGHLTLENLITGSMPDPEK